MATSFPTSLDTLTNPTSSDSLSSPSHSSQHANVNDAVEALQAKVGADSSAVTTSHDYLITDHASRITTLEALGTPTTYSPTHTDITVGNGTEVARYIKIGKLVQVSYKLTWGSTTSFGATSIAVGLPFTANADAFGSGLHTDTGSSNYHLLANVVSGTSVAIIRTYNIAGSYARGDNFTRSNLPFIWTSGDVLHFSLVYEAQ